MPRRRSKQPQHNDEPTSNSTDVEQSAAAAVSENIDETKSDPVQVIEPTAAESGTVLEDADRKAKDEADRKAKEEADRKAKEEADRKAKEEADRKAKEEADRKAKEEADRKAKEEADRKAKEDAEDRERKAKVERAKEYAFRKQQARNDNIVAAVGISVVALVLYTYFKR
jgi:uncharacterized protein YhaN